MDFSKIKRFHMDGIELKSISINGVHVWTGYKNWVKYSTESDGVTIYNNGLGYKDGYRVRSGGAEVEQGSTTSCTGFIPFKKGDVLRIYPQFHGLNIVNAINYANASFQNIGQATGSGGYGIC